MEQALYELPEGWEWKPLGTAAEVLGGGTPKTKVPEYWNGEITWLSPTDLPPIGEIAHISDSMKKITEIGLAKSSARLLPEGSVVFSSRATIGKIAITDCPLATNQGFTNFICPENLLNRYLAYVLVFLTPLIASLSNSTTFKEVSKTNIKAVEIPFPPLNEQKRIVAKLDAIFTRIDTAITHLQQTLELSKALFASALDGEFSSLSGRVKLSDIADVKGGKRLPKGNKLQDEPSSHPYIRVADFTNTGSIDVSGLKYISDEIYQQIKRYTISSKDLYISIAGTIGKTGIVSEKLEGANLTENAAKLVFKEPNNIDVRYIYYFTLSHDFSEQAGLATKVVAQPKLALTRLSKIQVPVPQIEIQQRIVANLDALAEHTRALEATTQEKLNDLTTLKASLLDAAFKGQL